MKNFYLLLVCVTLIFQSCKSDDCGDCFTPPNSFIFEIVDKASGENVFTNGTYVAGDIKITDRLNDNERIEFMFISEDNINQIQIGSIGWDTEIVNLKVSISGHEIFNLYVDAERKMGECCSYTEYNAITIIDAEFELDAETGIYKILVD